MAEKRELLKDQAYRDLKTMIIEGDIPPGTFLSERQLVQQMGMSKTPIRAALERLEQDGFIKTAPQQGIIVRELPLKEIIDHYDIRAALETFVVERLAGQLTPPQSERLRANLDEQRAQLGTTNFKRYVALDGDFHLMLCEFLSNREIWRVMQHQRDKLHRVTYHILERDPRRMQTSYEEHTAILEAIEEGNHALAVQRMRTHLENGKRFLLNL